MARLIGIAMLAAAAASFAFAGVSSTPEIDASTGVAGLVLISGGLLVLRARRRK